MSFQVGEKPQLRLPGRRDSWQYRFYARALMRAAYLAHGLTRDDLDSDWTQFERQLAAASDDSARRELLAQVFEIVEIGAPAG